MTSLIQQNLEIMRFLFRLRRTLLILPMLWILRPSMAASVDTVLVRSPSMKKFIKVVVIQPDGYQNLARGMPVLYLLHGYGGNYAQWLQVAPQLKERADQLKLLIVCPDGGFGSWYLDNPLDSSIRYETFISVELIRYIDKQYRTRPDRRFRAISGLSMGGHGALFLAIRHPNLFGAVGSLSGVVDLPRFFPRTDSLAQPSDKLLQLISRYSVINLVDSLKNDELRITFDCGVSDWLIYVNRELHQKLLKLKIDHDYAERPGKHEPAYWRNAIDYQLIFFRKFFQESGEGAISIR